MKAIVYENYGTPKVLQLTTVDRPHPKKNELLIRVIASTATAAEGMMRRGDSLMSRVVLGWFKPRKKYRVLGIEFSGIVEENNALHHPLKKGDEVFGFAGFHPGAYAEYLCLPQKASVVKKPINLNFKEAASVVDGASTAYFFLKEKAAIQYGQRVLVIGASGSIGCYAVQLANYYGAEVTGICSSKNADLVQRLGARQVIDYQKEDFTTRSDRYDIIFDTVGKSSFSAAKLALNEKGIYLATNGKLLQNIFLNLKTKMSRGKRFVYAMSVNKTNTLGVLKEIIEAGKLLPVIDKTYALDQIQEAHHYVESGHKVGNVVITI